MAKTGTLLLTLILLVAPKVIWAQVDSSTNSSIRKDSFSIALEFRPRTEFRDGYRQLRTDTTHFAFFTEQRSRLYINYRREGFIFHTSVQDVRVWGEQDPRATEGTLQIFEAYVEPTLTKELSVRIGRQKIMYDNQRLFAQNDWRQTGGAHDAVRFMYKKKGLEADVIGAFNQEKGAQNRAFGTDFSPGFDNYKVLLANFVRYQTSKGSVLTAINATDAFQDQNSSEKPHWRFTSGGRIEHTTQNKLYLTLAAYYQYGSTPNGKDLRAWYLQPEVKYTAPQHWVFSLGAEIFSGDEALNPTQTSHSFDALYGVNHRFLGAMDYFTRFPGDMNNAGIVNPYLFAFYTINKKLTLRADSHLFYSQNRFVPEGENQAINKFLGFENDLLVRFKPNAITELNLGYSYALVTQSMEYIKGGGDSSLFQSWAFLMITFTPELFHWDHAY